MAKRPHSRRPAAASRRAPFLRWSGRARTARLSAPPAPDDAPRMRRAPPAVARAARSTPAHRTQPGPRAVGEPLGHGRGRAGTRP